MVRMVDEMGIANPVLAAPMSGGPTTPAMVAAAQQAESFGFVAGGYKSVEELAAQIREVRASTSVFGVNLFAPNPVLIDPEEYREYAVAIQREADDFELDLAEIEPREDDDEWVGKVELLISDPVPLVSFTFGIPERSVVEALRRVESLTMQTVTSLSEAEMASAAGVDVLAVQSHEAGGHSATLTPRDPSPPVPLVELVRDVRELTGLPVVAAGGLATTEMIKPVMYAGAEAVMVGTYLLRTDESGASATYKTALAERLDAETRVTRSFTGRPARGIRNAFMDRYDEIAPLGYPAVHYLTIPLRRAAAAAGDADRVNLWAGTGLALAPEGSAATALAELGRGV